MTNPPGDAQLIIASNRGPVDFHAEPDGTIRAQRGEGGLINVLGPGLAGTKGLWIAAARTEGDRLAARRSAAQGIPLTLELPAGSVRLRGVPVDDDDYQAFYATVSTQTLWFLHHQLFDPVRSPAFDAAFHADWSAYERVNSRFAAACAEEAAQGAVVLLQDYHLAVAPSRLRAARPDLRIAHFTMCPWADPAYFRVLPRSVALRLIEGMLGADVLAFLAPQWAVNFLRCCQELGFEVDERARTVRHAEGVAAVRIYAVGVAVDELRERMTLPAVRAEQAWLEDLVGDRLLVTRVERMEPAKNILRGIAAFADFLVQNPHQAGRVVHYVLAYASRSSLSAYQLYADDVRTAVGEVNERFGIPGWQPIVLDTDNSFERGLALMARSDVLVVNPLRDGMNLVAKEGPAVSERDTVLILSREAGAAEELAEGALLVNPFDVEELATAIATAIAMPASERHRRRAFLVEAAGALPPKLWLATVLGDLEALPSRIATAS